ncbi:MAG: DNA polymerase I [Candidatus Omnitrophica bacterium]|nr:DNA polymerase I [Candidatus Omnitrophota bacterium]
MNLYAENRPKLFLIDGTSFCYRAYYAIRSLSNSKGEPTNAIYGFVTMMRKLIEEKKPDYMAVCFDRKEPTFRHQRYKEYKAHRKPMPDDLVAQLEPIKNFCRAWPLAVYEEAGYEADDLLGTIAGKAAKKGLDVLLVTGDKDMFQLVSERIKVLNPYKEDMIFDAKEVEKKFDGLGPEKVADVMALMGDASDNIPGVPGVGEKTAVKLIQEFGSVENLLAHTSRLKSKSQQALFKENESLARLSKDLALIDTQVPFDIDWDQMKLQTPDQAKLFEFFKHFEFRTLMKDCMPTGETQQASRRYKIVQTEKDFEKLIADLKKAKAFSFDTETTSSDPIKAELVGMSFCWKDYEAVYLPISSKKHQGPGLPLEKVLAAMRPILENPSQEKYGQNFKYDWIVLKRHGIEIRGITFDTMLASYLVNPLRRNHNLDDISLEHLSVKKITTDSLIGTGKKQITMDQVLLEKIAEYAAEDADCVFRLVPVLKQKLEEHGLLKLMTELELPLAGVLAEMEMNGVSLDLKFLAELSENATEDLDRLSQKIYREAGEEFNIDSPKQLSDILFTKMKLPAIRRTKTGYSTDVAVLEKLAMTYDLPKMLLEYREKSKLRSTYLDALPAIVNQATGLVHTSYHQTTTVTGRLSSTEPNLQNIPIRTETGRMIRKGFVPRESGKDKRKIFSADYSQIELRILAHLSGDPNLTHAFEEDRDIHNFTATLLYGVGEKDVTREMRNFAKVINFSVIYGKTAYGLSGDLGVSITEADSFIENYFNRYKTVKDYIESQKETARKTGFLTTILGRRSYFPDINSKNMQIRQFAERAAVNAPIQGSAADLIKLAMINIQKEMAAGKFESLMIMQVHDELVFDLLEKEKEKFTAMIKKEMESAFKLRVPLRVDTFVGDSWYKN